MVNQAVRNCQEQLYQVKKDTNLFLRDRFSSFSVSNSFPSSEILHGFPHSLCIPFIYGKGKSRAAIP